MARLVGDIDRELTVHTEIEETVFYPWARGLSGSTAAAVDEGLEEPGLSRTGHHHGGAGAGLAELSARAVRIRCQFGRGSEPPENAGSRVPTLRAVARWPPR
jgi:hypothetical protein